jgi:hypothetical protein
MKMRQRLLGAVLLLAIATPACSSTEEPDAAPPLLAPDDSVAGGQAVRLRVNTHCGVERLSMPVNGVFWITDEARGAPDWMPPEWKATQVSGEELTTLTIELSADQSQLTASFAGRSVEYRQIAESDPVVGCA